jgi:hypothetical protein
MHANYRVILELEERGDPIQGFVGLECKAGVRFDGYVQLIGHLEAIRSCLVDLHGSEVSGAAPTGSTCSPPARPTKGAQS